MMNDVHVLEKCSHLLLSLITPTKKKRIQESNFRTRVMELEEQLKHATTTTTTTAPGDQNGTKEVISSSNEDEGTNEVVSTLRAELALLLQERMELKRQLDELKIQRNETTITNDDDATLQQQQQRLVKLEQELMALNERYSIELAEVQHQLKAEQDLRHEGESVLTQSMESLQQQYALLTEQRDGLQQELQTLQDTHATELVQLEHQIRSESQQTTTEGAALRAEIEMQSNQLAKLELQWKELQQLHASEVKDLTAQWKTEQALRLEQERSMALELHRLEQKYKTDLQKVRTMGNHQNNVVGQSQYRAEKIQYDMTSQLNDQKKVLQDLQSKLQTTELELQAFTTYTEALVEERNSLRKLAQQSVNVVKERVQTRWSKIWGAKRGKKSEPTTMTENDASTTAEVPVYLQSKLEMTELQSQTITTNTEDVVEERNSRIQLAQQSWNVVKGKLQTRWSKISGAKIWKKSKPNNTEDDASISGQVPLYWQE